MTMLTIGQLAKRVGIRTSTLRYYEKEGLVQPAKRTEAGYRLYESKTIEKLRLIQRAQRVGFSLADIRLLIDGWERSDLSHELLIKTAEQRFIAVEEELTKLSVIKHELTHFLQDLYAHKRQETAKEDNAFVELVDRICPHPEERSATVVALDKLSYYDRCQLTSAQANKITSKLKNQHVHIWRERDEYHILIISNDAEVGEALELLVYMEQTCEVHADMTRSITHDQEGFLLTVSGENSFLYAQLFLALENGRFAP